MSERQLKNRQEVAVEFQRRGLAVRKWARIHGYSYEAVRDVLRKDSPWRFGERFKIAVALGMKDGIIADDYTP